MQQVDFLFCSKQREKRKFFCDENHVRQLFQWRSLFRITWNSVFCWQIELKNCLVCVDVNFDRKCVDPHSAVEWNERNVRVWHLQPKQTISFETLSMSVVLNLHDSVRPWTAIVFIVFSLHSGGFYSLPTSRLSRTFSFLLCIDAGSFTFCFVEKSYWNFAIYQFPFSFLWFLA